MWTKLKRKFFSIFERKRKNKNEENADESYERLEHLLSQRLTEDMELQSDGKWVSKSLVQAICAETSEQKLLNLCHQKEIHRLESLFNKEFFKQKELLWSGCYSEVVKIKNLNGEDIVLKISLINRKNRDGVVVQNESSIVTDVINSKRLSDLKSTPIELAENYCENFVDIQNFHFVYSHRSVFNKSEFRPTKEREDRNKIYQYFICQQSFSGKQLDSLDSLTPSKAVSLVLQLIASLAVAEEALHFEHRDLHSSNLLHRQTTQRFASYAIDGKKFELSLSGIKLVIIDTTFSRTDIKIRQNNGKEVTHYFYNDLSSLNLEDYRNQELKKVYLKQKTITSNKWKHFKPETNIAWLTYCSQAICLKADKGCRNRSVTSRQELAHLKHIHQMIVGHRSAKELCLELLADNKFENFKNFMQQFVE